MNQHMKLITQMTACIFVAVFSVFILWGVIITPERYVGQIEILDRNIESVMGLTGSATAASAAVSLIPGDTATPIAEKLADFSSYFVIVLCVLYLEKFLLVLTGKFACLIGVPIICLLYLIRLLSRAFRYEGRFVNPKILENLTIKMIILTICVGLVIPVSVLVSNAVYLQYQTTIDESLEAAQKYSGDIQEAVEEEEDVGILEGITGKITETLNLAADGAKELVSSFVESLAIMIVVSCLIPVLVLVLFIWVIKTLVTIPLGTKL